MAPVEKAAVQKAAEATTLKAATQKVVEAKTVKMAAVKKDSEEAVVEKAYGMSAIEKAAAKKATEATTEKAAVVEWDPVVAEMAAEGVAVKKAIFSNFPLVTEHI